MATGKKRILLVDDEKVIRCLLTDLLREAGYELAEAEDGKAALEQVKKKHPDLIILDVNMPKMSGFQVLEHLKKNPKTQGIPVIMLTTRAEQDDVEMGIGLDADKYIPKPFESGKLLYEIQQTFEVRGIF